MVLFLLENIVAETASQAVDTLLGKVSLMAFGIDHQMDVRVVTGIVECCVPLEIREGNLVCVCDGGHVPSDQGLPGFCVVVAQPLRILPVEAYDVCPDIALMSGDFLGCLVQIDGVIRLSCSI